MQLDFVSTMFLKLLQYTLTLSTMNYLIQPPVITTYYVLINYKIETQNNTTGDHLPNLATLSAQA